MLITCFGFIASLLLRTRGCQHVLLLACPVNSEALRWSDAGLGPASILAEGERECEEGSVNKGQRRNRLHEQRERVQKHCDHFDPLCERHAGIRRLKGRADNMARALCPSAYACPRSGAQNTLVGKD